MSTRRSQNAAPAGLSDESVAEYLRADPGFFERNLDLLAALRVPHPVGGAVSLVERQIAVLQERSRHLERKLQELVRVARENEQLGTRMHQLALAMLAAESADEVMAAAQEILRHQFRTDFVVFRLTEAAGPVARSHPDLTLAPDSTERRRLRRCLEVRKPICGRLQREEIDALFRDEAEQVASAALLPLRDAEPFGVLALGSRQRQRFNPAMGTLFLGHMGELVGAALGRFTAG